jgi:hypothetical protein
LRNARRQWPEQNRCGDNAVATRAASSCSRFAFREQNRCGDNAVATANST